MKKITLKNLTALLLMSLSTNILANDSIWHVKGIHPNGEELLSIKAIDKMGKFHPVKALYDEESHALDIKVLDANGEVLHGVKAVNEISDKYHGIKALTASGELLPIKAIDNQGNRYDVKSIVTKSNTMSVKIVAKDGFIIAVKAISPLGQMFDVKSFNFDDTKIGHMHVKAVPHYIE
jgi:hypothetical protein